MLSKRVLALIGLSIAMPLASLAAPAPLAFVPGQSHFAAPQADIAPLEMHPAREAIRSAYMVVLKPGVTSSAFLAHRERINSAHAAASAFHGERATDGLGHIYDMGAHFQGYAGRFTDDVLAYIRAQPEVEFVEVDTIVRTTELPQGDEMVWDIPYETSIEEAFAARDDRVAALETEKGAPWGLARISHRKTLGFGTFNKYLYDSNGGEGVTAYVIDTGINVNHVEFEGRARWGKTMPQGDTDTDGNGHGTHCAGTIGSRKYGVAKKIDLVAVKVLGSGGSGSMSDVTGGVLWAVEDAEKISKNYTLNADKGAKKPKGFVANMSLGGGKSPALDKAVNGAVSAGMHFAVAAGNENANACNTSPAGAELPVTVGASTIQDERAYFSNKGPCVDIFAPGLNILSTWNTGNNSVNTISGTSMASPHTVGLLGYLLSIYGSEEFSRIAGEEASEPAQLTVSDYTNNLAEKLHRALPGLPLPSLALGFLSSALEALAPLPPKKPSVIGILEPLTLKKAMIKLATSGILDDLDADTVNKLAFNNATTSSFQ